MCRRGARSFPGFRFTTICGWAAASRPAPSVTSSPRCWRSFRASKPLLDRPGGALSGGEQQLLAIARCLCGKPRLILLDEPTEGIQPSIIDEIVETLQRLRDNSGLTMILVEQNLDFIAALSQRILIIQKGTITREVQPHQLADAESGRRVHRNHHIGPGQRATTKGRPDHGRQKTHARSIARRRRRPRHGYGRRGAQILRRPDAGRITPPTTWSMRCRTMFRP